MREFYNHMCMLYPQMNDVSQEVSQDRTCTNATFAEIAHCLQKHKWCKTISQLYGQQDCATQDWYDRCSRLVPGCIEKALPTHFDRSDRLAVQKACKERCDSCAREVYGHCVGPGADFRSAQIGPVRRLLIESNGSQSTALHQRSTNTEGVTGLDESLSGKRTC